MLIFLYIDFVMLYALKLTWVLQTTGLDCWRDRNQVVTIINNNYIIIIIISSSTGGFLQIMAVVIMILLCLGTNVPKYVSSISSEQWACIHVFEVSSTLHTIIRF